MLEEVDLEEIDDSIGRRQILIMHAMTSMALVIYRKKEQYHQQVGISLAPDGTEDTKLYVRELPDITVGLWKIEDSTRTMDSDEEVEYHTSRYCRCRNPCYSTRATPYIELVLVLFVNRN